MPGYKFLRFYLAPKLKSIIGATSYNLIGLTDFKNLFNRLLRLEDSNSYCTSARHAKHFSSSILTML